MSDQNLLGKRVLITQADMFMGPVLCEVFARHGATVIANAASLVDVEAPAAIVAEAGRVDVLVANLAIPAPSTAVVEVSEAEWSASFGVLVDPLARLFRAVLPAMIARRSGKILVMGSASALRGMKRASTYSAARGAQLAYVQAVGVEVAPHNVQVNAIAQNFVDNPTYFPPEVQADPRFQDRLKREVPLGRLVGAEEDA
ncbi:MAG: SDR family oxidoreductase, partial [Azonexus sp.]|nr:SDR family oxidoreductase [Azonexus sp.]